MTETRSDLEQVARSEGMVAMLRAALKNADAIVTGAVGTEKLHLLMIPGRLVQAARNGDFIGQLADELDVLRAKGAIKEEFEQSEDGKASLPQLLAALEDPPVDSSKFNVLKAIFVAAARKDGPAHSPGTPQLLMSIARQLSPGEILVLATAYSIATGEPQIRHQINKDDARGWLGLVASKSGMQAASMVEFYEEQLMDKHLLTPRLWSDRSGANFGAHFRLTDLGVKLCSFISAGEPVPNP